MNDIDINKNIKSYIDANVWDGEDRSGCKSDRASFDPDELFELACDAANESYCALMLRIQELEAQLAKNPEFKSEDHAKNLMYAAQEFLLKQITPADMPADEVGENSRETDQ